MIFLYSIRILLLLFFCTNNLFPFSLSFFFSFFLIVHVYVITLLCIIDIVYKNIIYVYIFFYYPLYDLLLSKVSLKFDGGFWNIFCSWKMWIFFFFLYFIYKLIKTVHHLVGRFPIIFSILCPHRCSLRHNATNQI